MTSKITPELKPEYKKLKEELKRLKSENTLDVVKKEVLERVIFKELPQVCAFCGETKFLTLDHIVPQSLLTDLNVFEIIEDNYQILCRYCNSKKANRLDIRNPKTKEILRKIIS